MAQAKNQKTMENWLLKKFISDIQIVHDDDRMYLRECSRNYDVRLNKSGDKRTVFAWPHITHYSFFFDFKESESVVSHWLFNSTLMNYDKVIIEFGPCLPVIEVSTIIFVENWYDFVNTNGSIGTSVMTKNWELIIEFTDDTDYLLYSNFLVNPSTVVELSIA